MLGDVEGLIYKTNTVFYKRNGKKIKKGIFYAEPSALFFTFDLLYT